MTRPPRRGPVPRRPDEHGTLPQVHVPPVRTCVGCRERDSRSNLVRLVARGDRVVVDRDGAMAGRGAWLHPSSQCLENARRRRSLDRALRGRFRVDDIADQLLDRHDDQAE
ncbi:MAG: YlxR family protein [Actinomycetales bacterium]|nr:YlxR family protein [Actinomycetales bacterium]